jgi:OOP family OmpA-OmpF porin
MVVVSPQEEEAMKRILGVGIVVCAATAGAAHAWEPGPYLGFALGSTSFDLDVADYDDGNLLGGSVDTSDTGYKLFGGYRITPNVGAELYYANLGDSTFRGRAGAQVDHWCEGPVASEVEVDGLGVSLLGNVPVGRDFNIYGKFGIFAWDWDARESDSCGNFRDSESGTELAFGAGVSYQINYLTSVHLEWERYNDVLDSFSGEFDVDFFSLGLSFSLY